jgi:endonuclease YncB( thermonuclease family)
MRAGSVRFALLVACLAMPGVTQAEIAGVVRVIDGDTLDVGSTRVRLFGIDAPEQDQMCVTEQGAEWPCGAWVTAEVSQRYSGERARCTAVDTDRYGRTVARCTVAGQDMGQEIVSAGLAFAYRRYSMDYDLDEKGAAVRDIGLHASRVQSPSQFRQARTTSRMPRDRSCAIKGNISGKGARIYHVPGQQDYELTGIREEKGERWFCSEAEARAAGWRPARR